MASVLLSSVAVLDPSLQSRLAAYELQRAVFEVSDLLLDIYLPPLNLSSLPQASVYISPRPPPGVSAAQRGGYAVHAAESALWVHGDDVVRGACALVERHLGVRYTFDIGPALRVPSSARTPGEFPRVPLASFGDAPRFARRGLQPFHDFPEGPDWWGVDEYKAVLEALARGGFNMLALHTYPLVEPTVWVGTVGNISVTAYPTTYANQLRGTWGYSPLPSSNYSCGAAALYEADCYSTLPHCLPTGTAQSLDQFAAAAAILSPAFRWGVALGVYGMVGTETPLAVPDPSVPAADYYDGMLEYIARNYPVPAVWAWTGEEWEWGGFNVSNPVVSQAVADLRVLDAANARRPRPFDLTVCGWVVGPLPDRAYFDTALPPAAASTIATLASLDPDLGRYPPDEAFGRITRHGKMAIPWLEDDPGLTAGQLWVARTLLHADAAAAMGVGGLLGIHWRLAPIEPQLAALAAASRASGAGLTAAAFWAQWCATEVGVSAAAACAAVMGSLDSDGFPRPVDWVGGPGAVVARNVSDADVALQYSFVDAWAATVVAHCRPATPELARAEFWAAHFAYVRELAYVGGWWFRLGRAMLALRNQPPSQQRAWARQHVVPLRAGVVAHWAAAMTLLQSFAERSGELGTVMNLEAHSLPAVLPPADTAFLAAVLGGALPANCTLPDVYAGPPRVAVRVARSVLAAGERMVLEARVVAPPTPAIDRVLVMWRVANDTRWSSIELAPVAAGRRVYRIAMPPLGPPGVYAWRVEAEFGAGVVFWPPWQNGVATTVQL